jgi:hypothetical protein
MEAMRRIEKAVLEEWIAADRAVRGHFVPHEFLVTRFSQQIN